MIRYEMIWEVCWCDAQKKLITLPVPASLGVPPPQKKAFGDQSCRPSKMVTYRAKGESLDSLGTWEPRKMDSTVAM